MGVPNGARPCSDEVSPHSMALPLSVHTVPFEALENTNFAPLKPISDWNLPMPLLPPNRASGGLPNVEPTSR